MLETTQLQPGWLHAWPATAGLALAGLLASAVGGDGGKRLADTSWYGPREKLYAALMSLLFLGMVTLSVFLPFATAHALLLPGITLMGISAFLQVISYQAYVRTPAGTPVRSGPFMVSRNPIYLFTTTYLLGVAVVTASCLFMTLLAFYAACQHLLILSEEQYCTQAYGVSFVKYMRDTHRYAGFPLSNNPKPSSSRPDSGLN